MSMWCNLCANNSDCGLKQHKKTPVTMVLHYRYITRTSYKCQNSLRKYYQLRDISGQCKISSLIQSCHASVMCRRNFYFCCLQQLKTSSNSAETTLWLAMNCCLQFHDISLLPNLPSFPDLPEKWSPNLYIQFVLEYTTNRKILSHRVSASINCLANLCYEPGKSCNFISQW